MLFLGEVIINNHVGRHYNLLILAQLTIFFKCCTSFMSQIFMKCESFLKVITILLDPPPPPPLLLGNKEYCNFHSCSKDSSIWQNEIPHILTHSRISTTTHLNLSCILKMLRNITTFPTKKYFSLLMHHEYGILGSYNSIFCILTKNRTL